MIETLRWLSLSSALIGFALLGSFLITVLVWWSGVATDIRIPSRVRHMLTWVTGLLPLTTSSFVLVIAFGPSLLDFFGIATDHCRYHLGHDFHLCFVHGSSPAPSSLMSALTVFLVASIGWALAREFGRSIESLRWVWRLERLAHFDANSGLYRLETQKPIAFTVGYWAPKIFVSDGLESRLDSRQFRAVIEHEATHARGRHALIRAFVRGATGAYPEGLRRWFDETLAANAEHICDDSAAQLVGDRLVVAETILTMARDDRGQVPKTALQFGATAIEQRVRALVEPRPDEGLWGVFRPAVVATLVLPFFVLERLHHDAELLLSYVL